MKKFLSVVAAIVLIVAMNVTVSAQKIIVTQTSTARWKQDVSPDKFAAEVLRLTNAERAKVGVQPLKLSKDLTASALIRAMELPQKFAHERPNGYNFSSAFVTGRGHVVGENLAGGQTTPKQVVQAWMDSPGHRKNMLSKNYSELGVVYYYQPNSKYKHYWVQHFRG